MNRLDNATALTLDERAKELHNLIYQQEMQWRSHNRGRYPQSLYIGCEDHAILRDNETTRLDFESRANGEVYYRGYRLFVVTDKTHLKFVMSV